MNLRDDKLAPGVARTKWQDEAVAAHYASGRFRGERARARDARLVARLVRRHASTLAGSLLDAPCGTGRLSLPARSWSRSYVGVDVSAAMLREGEGRRVQGNATRLPFADGSFDIVLCCRLLHHLEATTELEAVARELLRVSRGLVIASFWDARSWPGLRRGRGWRRDETGRRALPRTELARAFERHGGRVRGYAASLRFVSMQTFVAITKACP